MTPDPTLKPYENLIPERFRCVPFRAERFPGSGLASDLTLGANCQLFAYELLRHHGFILPDLRSEEFWAEGAYTQATIKPRRFDIALMNRKPGAYGAHFGVVIDDGLILHLAYSNGFPMIEALDTLISPDRYPYLIGFKRCLQTQG